jgi:hypothetical protein
MTTNQEPCWYCNWPDVQTAWGYSQPPLNKAAKCPACADRAQIRELKEKVQRITANYDSALYVIGERNEQVDKLTHHMGVMRNTINSQKMRMADIREYILNAGKHSHDKRCHIWRNETCNCGLMELMS